MWFALALLQASAVRPHVTVTLVPEHSVIVPGAPLRVALRFQLEPGWHLYWRNPGESGIATTVQWTLPTGFKADSLEFPTPSRLDVAGVVAHVLGGEVVMQAVLQVAATAAAPADRSRIMAHVKYGVCKDACYPGDVYLRVEPGLGGTARRNPEWPAADSIFAATRPRDDGIAASVSYARDTALLTITPPRGCSARSVTFFPWDREIAAAAVTARVPGGCGQSVMRVPLTSRPVGALRGVVVFGDERRGYLIGKK